jgi:hypothetical protein
MLLKPTPTLRWLVCSAWLCVLGSASAQTAPSAAKPAANPAAWQDKTRLLPEALRQIPDALFVWDSPNPSYPEPDSANPSGYIWRHNTNVRLQGTEPLTVVACGSYIWYNTQGWFTNLNLSPEEFAENFGCPGGRILPNVTYTYKNNNRLARTSKGLFGGDALWYVIAVDSNGKRYKGLALVETEAGPILKTKP